MLFLILNVFVSVVSMQCVYLVAAVSAELLWTYKHGSQDGISSLHTALLNSI